MESFTLPDLGEGLEDAEIVTWHVNEGDHVVADQPLLSVETDKAIVEVPSPVSGCIARLHGKPGDVVKVGATLVDYETTVGPDADAGTVVGELQRADENLHEAPQSVQRAAAGEVRAVPAVRALAVKLDVDLSTLRPSGPEGSITLADVERAAQAPARPARGEAVRGMRRAMAQRMARAGGEVVAAGVTDDADIGDWDEAADVTVRLIRAIATAVTAEPGLNATYEAGSGVRRLNTRIDVGIAVDTEVGLIVPVLRNVGQRDAIDLRAGLDRLRADAKARSIPPRALKGATITLSNFGMFAGRYAHLVIVPPQVAIVGSGRVAERVVSHHGRPAVRRTLPLTLIFDHRIVTGGEGARFMGALKADLERSE